MTDNQISLSLLWSRVHELENFKEMMLKKYPDLSIELKEYSEEKKKRECEECCNCCKNLLIACGVIFDCYIFYEIVTNNWS